MIKTDQEAEKVKSIITEINQPAPTDWIATRVMILLSHFYVSDLPEVVQEGIANDWMKELKEYPAFAIDNACSWWIGKENEKKRRRKKPLPGDISELAHAEIAPIRAASRCLDIYARYGDNPPQYLNR